MKLEDFDCPFCDQESGFWFNQREVVNGKLVHHGPVEKMPNCPACGMLCEFEYACVPQGDGSGMEWILREPGPDIY